MSRLDTLAAGVRAGALANPLTKAHAPVLPSLGLAGGVYVALSVNL